MLLGCGHCKKMKPEFTIAAQQLKDQEVTILYQTNYTNVNFFLRKVIFKKLRNNEKCRLLNLEC